MQWIVAAIMSLLAVAPASAQQSGQSPNMAQRSCAAGETRSATVAEISALGDAAIGQCYSIEGVATGFWLYADNAARYRPSRADNEPSSSGAVLGLYGRDRGLPPARVRVTGRVDRCERIFDAVVAQGGIPFLSGYCHYYRGYVLYGQRVEELTPFEFTRITLRDAGDLGTLRPIAEEAVRRRLLAAATPFFNALESRDEASLRSLIAQSQNQQESQVDELLEHLAIRQWRFLGQFGARYVEALGWRRPADATAEQVAAWTRDAASGPEGYVCSAGRVFAEDHLWPIIPADTDMADGRPYLCVRIWLPTGRPPSYSFGLARYPEAASREPTP